MHDKLLKLKDLIDQLQLMESQDSELQEVTADLLSISNQLDSVESINQRFERYNAIFASAGVGIIFFDSNGYVLEVNSTFSAITGIPLEALIGQNVKALMHKYLDEDTFVHISTKIDLVMKGHAIPSFEFPFNDKYLSITVPVRSEPAGIAVIVTNITDKIRIISELEESEGKFRNTVDYSPMGIHLWYLDENDDLIFEGANKAADTILKVNNQQYIGLTIERAFPALVGTQIPAIYKDVCRNGKTWHHEQYNYKDAKIHGVYEITVYKTSTNRIAAFFQDITERRLTEQALLESESRFRLIFQDSVIGIFRTTYDGKIQLANPKLISLLGYDSFNDLASLEDTSIVYQDRSERGRFIALFDKDDVIDGYDTTWVKKNGELINIRLNARAFRDTNGTITHFEGTVEDITEKKIAERELLRQEQQLQRDSYTLMFLNQLGTDLLETNDIQSVINLGVEAIYDLDIYKQVYIQILSESNTYQAFAGVEEGFNFNLTEQLLKSHSFPQILQDKAQVYSRSYYLSGMIDDSSASSIIINDVEALVIPLHDKTTKAIGYIWLSSLAGHFESIEQTVKSIELFSAKIELNLNRLFMITELKAEEEKFRLITDNVQDGLIVFNNEKIIYLNNRVRTITGYERSEFQTIEDIYRLMDDAEKTKIFEYFDNIMPGDFSESLELWIKTKTNQQRLISNKISMRKLPNGDELYYVIFADITEKHYADIALKESEKKYRELVDFSLTGIYITQKHIIRFCNQRFAQMFGYDLPDELLGMHVKDLVASEDWTTVERNVLIRESGQQDSIQYTFTGIRKDGSRINIETIGARILFAGESAIQGNMIDITTRVIAERNLTQAQKLESLNLLASGIAHDFNNILTALTNNIYHAKLELPANHISFNALDNAEKALLRATSLTRQLLALSKDQPSEMKPSQIGSLLYETTVFSIHGSNVKIEFDLPGNLWLVKVDENQISQVIQNLIINAIQSMPSGGTIKVGARNKEVTQSLNLNIKSGKYVEIIIQDFGIGIPAANLSKIFDPYFTTKPSGTGLGLATSYSIITKHKGIITVNSKENEGSTFHVFLPKTNESPPAAKKEFDPTVKRSGRILIMDDEEIIRKSTGNLLNRVGYEVHLAKNGPELIAKFKQSLQDEIKFDLLILDLTIPGGMGGREVIGELLTLDPDVKAIASSGYANDPVMQNPTQYGFKGVITKPYLLNDLLALLDEII